MTEKISEFSRYWKSLLGTPLPSRMMTRVFTTSVKCIIDHYWETDSKSEGGNTRKQRRVDVYIPVKRHIYTEARRVKTSEGFKYELYDVVKDSRAFGGDIMVSPSQTRKLVTTTKGESVFSGEDALAILKLRENGRLQEGVLAQELPKNHYSKFSALFPSPAKPFVSESALPATAQPA